MEKEIHGQTSQENTLRYIASGSKIMHISIVKVLSPDVNKLNYLSIWNAFEKIFKLW